MKLSPFTAHKRYNQVCNQWLSFVYTKCQELLNYLTMSHFPKLKRSSFYSSQWESQFIWAIYAVCASCLSTLWHSLHFAPPKNPSFVSNSLKIHLRFRNQVICNNLPLSLHLCYLPRILLTLTIHKATSVLNTFLVPLPDFTKSVIGLDFTLLLTL